MGVEKVSLDELFKRYNLDNKRFHWFLMFSYGYWDNCKCTYFEFRIMYKKLEQKETFVYLNALADYLDKNREMYKNI